MCKSNKCNVSYYIEITAPCGKVLITSEVKQMYFDTLDDKEAMLRLSQLGAALGIGDKGWRVKVKKESLVGNVHELKTKWLTSYER